MYKYMSGFGLERGAQPTAHRESYMHSTTLVYNGFTSPVMYSEYLFVVVPNRHCSAGLL